MPGQRWRWVAKDIKASEQARHPDPSLQRISRQADTRVRPQQRVCGQETVPASFRKVALVCAAHARAMSVFPVPASTSSLTGLLTGGWGRLLARCRGRFWGAVPLRGWVGHDRHHQPWGPLHSKHLRAASTAHCAGTGQHACPQPCCHLPTAWCSTRVLRALFHSRCAPQSPAWTSRKARVGVGVSMQCPPSPLGALQTSIRPVPYPVQRNRGAQACTWGAVEEDALGGLDAQLLELFSVRDGQHHSLH